MTFPWNSPVSQHEAEQGVTDAFGLKFRDGPGHTVVIDNVAADSAAARKGLAAAMEISAINGETVLGSQHAGQQVWPSTSSISYSATTANVFHWHVDDPPEWQTDGSGPLKIYGLEIGGGDQEMPPRISHVRWQSPDTRQAFAPASGCEAFRAAAKRSANFDASSTNIAASPGSYPAAGLRHRTGRAAFARQQAVHPTQVYSTIDALILCSCYWSMTVSAAATAR